ncbi:MAG: hypothetical protein WCV00_02900 [Verrucomicrobiia bacterium]
MFGVLEILIGCFCTLMIPLMLWGQAIQAQMTKAPPDYSMLVPAALIYATLGVAFIWLGIGSILCRRWARALLLILSWSWLLVGVIAVGANAFLMPRILETLPTGPGKTIVLITMLVTFTVIMVIVPGVMVLFYRGKNVKATCEARDPVTRWTDACPLPVLAASLWLGFGALSMLSMPLGYKSVMPFFGTLLTGFPATLFFVIWAVGSVWLAWAFYRLKPAAWWIVVAAFVLISVSSTITFARVDLMEMYRQMGYPQQQIEQIQKYSFFSGRSMAVWMVCCMVPWLGYLLWIKKFFCRSA